MAKPRYVLHGGMWVPEAAPKKKTRPKPVPIVTEHTRGQADIAGSNAARGAASTGGPGRAQVAATANLVQRFNARKAKVADIQKMLRHAGYDIAVDGIIGPQTRRAWSQHVAALNRAQRADAVRKAQAMARVPNTDPLHPAHLGVRSPLAKPLVSTALGRTRAREDIFRQEQYVNEAQQSAIARGVKPPSRQQLAAEYQAQSRPGMLAHGVTQRDYRIAQSRLYRGRGAFQAQLAGTAAGLGKYLGHTAGAALAPPVGPTAKFHERQRVQSAGYTMDIGGALKKQAIHDIHHPYSPLTWLDVATTAYLPFAGLARGRAALVAGRTAAADRAAAAAADFGASRAAGVEGIRLPSGRVVGESTVLPRRGGAARKALVGRPPADILTPRSWLPADMPAGTRVVRLGEHGGGEQFRLSPNPVAAAVQHRLDRFAEAHPHMRGVGSVARVARQGRKTMQIEQHRVESALIPFNEASKSIKLDSPEDVALGRIITYGPDNRERAAELLDAEIAKHRRELEKPVVKPHYEEDAAGRKTVVQPEGTIGPVDAENLRYTVKALESAKPHITEVNKQLDEAVARGVDLLDLGEQIRVDTAGLTEETRAANVHRRARLVTGGRYRTKADVRAEINWLRRRRAGVARQEKWVQGRMQRVLNPAPTNREIAYAKHHRIGERMSGQRARLALHMDRTAQQLAKAEAGGLHDLYAPLKLRHQRENEKLADMYAKGTVIEGGAADAPYVAQHNVIKAVERKLDKAARAKVRVDKARARHAAAFEAHDAAMEEGVAHAARERELAQGWNEEFNAIHDRREDILSGHARSLENLAGQRRRIDERLGELLPGWETETIVGGEQAGEGARFLQSQPRRQGFFARFGGGAGRTGRQRPIIHKATGALLHRGGEELSGRRLITSHFATSARYALTEEKIAKADKFALDLALDAKPLEGHRFWNPQGLKIARKQREARPPDLGIPPEKLTTAASSEIEDALQATHEMDTSIHGKLFPSDADVANMSAKERQGLRQIDERIQKSYFPEPTLRTGGEKKVAQALDATNNVTRGALIYFNPSYFARNFAGNLAFMALHQGVFSPRNLERASGLMGRMDPELLRRVDTEAGSGGALAMREVSTGKSKGKLGEYTDRVAHWQNRAADTLPRRAAWFREATVRGYKTPEQIHQLLTDESLRPVLNQIGLDTRRAMVDFGDLTQFEQDIVSRLIFIYPWLKGATRYGKDLLVDRPVSAAIAAHVLDEKNKLQRQAGLDPMDPMLGSDIVPIGKVARKYGTTVAPVMNLQSMNPVGQALDIAQAARAAAFGGGSARDLPLKFLQPVFQAAVVAGTKTNWSGPTPSALKTFASEFAGTPDRPVFPLANIAKTAFTGTPSAEEIGKHDYIPEHGWKAALEYAGLGSARPRELNVPVEKARGIKATGDPRQRTIFGYQQKMESLDDVDWTPQLRAQVQRAINIAGARAAAQAKYPKNVHGRFRGDLDVAVKLGMISVAERARQMKVAKGMSEYTLAQTLKDGASTSIGAANDLFDPDGLLGSIDEAVSEKKRKASKG